MTASSDLDIPGRTIRVTVSHENHGEVAGFQERVNKVNAILETLCRSSKPVPYATLTMARDLARIWEARPSRRDEKLIEKVRKLRTSARSLLDDRDRLELSGVSSQMLYALAAMSETEIFEKRNEPKARRPANNGALQLALAFAYHYAVLTGKEPGVSRDHDFVYNLGLLFDALNFTAKSQHYAKEAVKAFKARRRDEAAE